MPKLVSLPVLSWAWNFSCSYVKMPTIVSILTFMSRKNSIPGMSEPEKCWISWYFNAYEHLKFYAQLSWAWKNVYNLGTWSNLTHDTKDLWVRKTYLAYFCLFHCTTATYWDTMQLMIDRWTEFIVAAFSCRYKILHSPHYPQALCVGLTTFELPFLKGCQMWAMNSLSWEVYRDKIFDIQHTG